jgi:hypothetical protein
MPKITQNIRVETPTQSLCKITYFVYVSGLISFNFTSQTLVTFKKQSKFIIATFCPKTFYIHFCNRVTNCLAGRTL